MTREKTISAAGLAIGLGLICIGAVVGYDTSLMQIPPSYSRVGPQVFPYIIAAGLVLCGLFVMWEGWRGEVQPEVIDPAQPTDWLAVVIIAAVLYAQVYLLTRLGFIVSATLVFLAVSYAFGSRKYVRDVIVAVILSIVTYIGFTQALGLHLPPGLLKGVF
ncbi:tripartite tricarboxylate transporter TctB family protein [soil metagenome]